MESERVILRAITLGSLSLAGVLFYAIISGPEKCAGSSFVVLAKSLQPVATAIPVVAPPTQLPPTSSLPTPLATAFQVVTPPTLLPPNSPLHYITLDDIRQISSYTPNMDTITNFIPEVHIFHDVVLCTELISDGSIVSIVVSRDGKIIDISSKYLSLFLKHNTFWVPGGYGPSFAACLKRVQSETPVQTLSSAVFYGYDTFIGLPGHHYEDLLNNLATRRLAGMEQRYSVLLPHFNNLYYNRSIDLVREHGNASVIWFAPGTIILLKSVAMTQSNDRFLPQTAAWFTATQIVPSVMSKFHGRPFYDKIAILKVNGNGSRFSSTPGRSHSYGQGFLNLLASRNITLIDTSSMAQDEVIYLVTAASYLLTTWGSTLTINYHFFRPDTRNLQVVVLCHPGYHDEWEYLLTSSRLNGPSYVYSTTRLHPHKPFKKLKFVFGADKAGFADLEALSGTDIDFNETMA
jgi:hypothetical protein